MKLNGDHEYKPDPNQPTPVGGKALVFSTIFGAVVHFPESKVGLTLLQYADGTTRRVRGYEKRILLSMIRALEEARRHPLPALSMN